MAHLAVWRGPAGEQPEQLLTTSVDVLSSKPLGRTIQPRLDDYFLEVVDGDLVETHQDRRVTVEVRCGEEDVRVIGEKGLLGDEVLYSCA